MASRVEEDMLAYTTYSEAGGVGKTTLAGNLAVAHQRQDLDVLAIDLDPQNASLSHLFNVDADRADPNVDTLAEHIIGQGSGPVEDLIQTAEGVDIIPAHNKLQQLPEWIVRAEINLENFDRHSRLRQILIDAGIPDQYDVIIADPPATEGPQLYNAVYATRSLIVPLELSGKGAESVSGLAELVGGIENRLDIDVYVPAIVPVGYDGRLNAHSRYLEEMRESEFDVPVVLSSRESLFGGCWDEQCSAYRYLEEYRDYPAKYERETLEKIDELAEHLQDGEAA